MKRVYKNLLYETMYGEGCIVLDKVLVKDYIKEREVLSESSKVQGVYSDEGLYDFFASFKDMPFMSCCVEEVRNILHRIFKPEDSMLLEGYDYNFLHKQLGRGKELLYMKKHSKTVQEELGIKFEINNDDKELGSAFAYIK